MATSNRIAPSLIEQLLPRYDFAAAYEVSIAAQPSVVYERLQMTDFFGPWIVRLLMMIRTGRRVPAQRPSDLRHGFEGPGFVVVAEASDAEVVIGVAGSFWRADGGRHLDLKASEFVGFERPGEAKAAWNFRLRAATPQSTVLSTETRIQCFGRSAWWKFGLYWALIAPFSGLIRQALLRQVKREAESVARAGL
jgi:hypothetical protein